MAYSQSQSHDSQVEEQLADLGLDQKQEPVSNLMPNYISEGNSTDKVDRSSMENFFERRKSDVMFELRSIQHGERPVTGQNHRDNLKHFMKKHLTSSSEREGKENVPANVDNVEEHRPDSIVFEVQGIIEQRPVSSILQSAALRRQLENVIRGSIVGTRSRNVESQRTRVRTNNPPPTQSSQRRVPERIPERPRLERNASSDSLASVNSFSSALSSQDQDYNERDLDPEVPTVQMDSASQNLPSSQPAAREWEQSLESARRELEQSTQSLARNLERELGQSSPAQAREVVHINADHASLGPAWNDVGRLHREELVQELSELVHSHLVSSTLDGEFRASLETLVQNRVSSSGSNGPAIEQFVRSLPGRGIPRNDFSHLGIGPAIDNDPWDNISITSVSAHSMPYTQTNTFLSREIQSLKSQMAEMKNMIKLSVDLQMDVQRAIRQEVAAALAQSTCQGACAAATPPSYPINDTHCLICLERHSDSVLYQCGHMCVCYMCGKDLVSRNHTCPVCRAPIKDVIRAYKTNSD